MTGLSVIEPAMAPDLPTGSVEDINDVRLIALPEAGHFATMADQPFGFRHSLHLNPIFNLEEIIALAGRLPDHVAFKAWQNGRVEVGDGWATPEGAWRPFDETLRDIAKSDSVVVLKHVEQDVLFGPVLRQLLQEIFSSAPAAFQDDVVIGECLIFVNSPGRRTPYHFDLEPSILLQVEGQKTAHAYASGNRTIVSLGELEDYCGVGNLSAGVYKPECAQHEHIFALGPGDGVYFPSTGPHWVVNDDTVSISVNVNFDMRSLHHGVNYLHGFNSRMRRLGLHPADPGTHPRLDALKVAVWSRIQRIKGALRSRVKGPSPLDGYPVWQPQR